MVASTTKQASDLERFQSNDLILTLWAKKVFIICCAVLGLSFGVGSYLLFPSKYTTTIEFTPPGDIEFSRYNSLVRSLRNENNGIFFNPDTVLRTFAKEFNGVVIEKVLKEHKLNRATLESLDEISAKKLVRKWAGEFLLIEQFNAEATNVKEPWRFQYTWHDKEAGDEIFQDVVIEISKRTKAKIKSALTNESLSVSFTQAQEKEVLSNELKFLEEEVLSTRDAHLTFLKRQYDVAVDLKIVENQIDSIFNTDIQIQTTEAGENTVRPRNIDLNYFMRGSEIIEAQMTSLKNQELKDLLQLNGEYLTILKKLDRIEANRTTYYLEQLAVSLDEDSILQMLGVFDVLPTRSLNKNIFMFTISSTLIFTLVCIFVVSFSHFLNNNAGRHQQLSE